jgi:hypothetical protein
MAARPFDAPLGPSHARWGKRGATQLTCRCPINRVSSIATNRSVFWLLQASNSVGGGSWGVRLSVGGRRQNCTHAVRRAATPICFTPNQEQHRGA